MPTLASSKKRLRQAEKSQGSATRVRRRLCVTSIKKMLATNSKGRSRSTDQSHAVHPLIKQPKKALYIAMRPPDTNRK